MAAHQAPSSLGFSRQEHWSGLPFPSPMHESESEVAQSCPTLHNTMDCSLPGFSIHGIFQARVLEWVPSPSLIYRAVSPKFTSSIQLLNSKTIISSYLFDTFIGRSHRLFNSIYPQVNRASLTAQLVKNPPAGQETPGQFLGWEDPLEKG